TVTSTSARAISVRRRSDTSSPIRGYPACRWCWRLPKPGRWTPSIWPRSAGLRSVSKLKLFLAGEHPAVLDELPNLPLAVGLGLLVAIRIGEGRRFRQRDLPRGAVNFDLLDFVRFLEILEHLEQLIEHLHQLLVGDG